MEVILNAGKNTHRHITSHILSVQARKDRDTPPIPISSNTCLKYVKLDRNKSPGTKLMH